MATSTISLKLKTTLSLPLEAPCLSPDTFAGKSTADLEKLPVHIGKEESTLGNYFEIKGSATEESQDICINLEGDLSRVNYVGYQMSQGVINIKGNIGTYLGTYLEGGKIKVQGNVDDYAGVQMTGGLLLIEGNAGHFVGGALPGQRIGMNGGHLIIKGNCGEHLGSFMSRGLIYVEGDTGNFIGTGMDAGTIVVKGNLGSRIGANMTRGSIICLSQVEEILPTFVYEGKFTLEAIRLTFMTLKQKHKIEITPELLKGEFLKFRGDRAEENGRGELFLYAKKNVHLLEAKQ